MSIRCDNTDVSLAGTGKLQLRSAWISDRPDGELARFEVRLSAEGNFRFLVEGAQTTRVEATQRQIKVGTVVEISTDYINRLGGPNKRLVSLWFYGITKDASGIEVRVGERAWTFLP